MFNSLRIAIKNTTFAVNSKENKSWERKKD